MDDLTAKEFMTISKAIFYQLFNRKLSFVVFSGDESKSNEWLFTNVGYETILMYDSNPDYFYSYVVIKNKAYLDKFYEYFPVLKSTACLIRVVDMLSTLSKLDDISKCSVQRRHNEIVMVYTDNDEEVIKPIGVHLMDIDVDMYQTLWRSGLITSEHSYSKEYTYMEITEVDGRTILHVSDSDGSDEHLPRRATVVVQYGFMLPSLSMFLKNMSDQNQSFTVCAGYDKDSVIVNARYDTDLLSCITTQPAQRWFVNKSKS